MRHIHSAQLFAFTSLGEILYSSYCLYVIRIFLPLARKVFCGVLRGHVSYLPLFPLPATRHFEVEKEEGG